MSDSTFADDFSETVATSQQHKQQHAAQCLEVEDTTVLTSIDSRISTSNSNDGINSIDQNDKNSNKNKNDNNNDTPVMLPIPPKRPIPYFLLHSPWTIWFDNPKVMAAGTKRGDVSTSTTSTTTTTTATTTSSAASTTENVTNSQPQVPKQPQQQDKWKENLLSCGTFRTIEEFWRIYNNIRPPSTLSMNSNYSIFRVGISPSWEDPANTYGGKFVLTIDKKESKQQQHQQHQQGNKLDDYWLLTVLAMIGETMDLNGSDIHGAVVSIRKTHDRIALWVKGGEHNEMERHTGVRIAERWKKVLNIEKEYVRYQTHKDAAASGRSFRNDVQYEV
jgi:translation initiation factor 4E